MASDEVLFSGSVTNEGGTARDGIVTRWKLFTPANPNLTPHDRIRYGGVVYEIDGQIGRARLNSSHVKNSYAVFCLKKKTTQYAVWMTDLDQHEPAGGSLRHS